MQLLYSLPCEQISENGHCVDLLGRIFLHRSAVVLLSMLF